MGSSINLNTYYYTKTEIDNQVIKKSNTPGLVKNDGTIDEEHYSTFSGSYNDLSNKPTIPSSSDIYSQIAEFGNALLTELGTVSNGDDKDY